MTREEFRDWVTEHDCSMTPVDGINHQGRSVRIVNDQYNWAYYYLRLPLDETEMPDIQVCEACENLHIPIPPLVNCY